MNKLFNLGLGFLVSFSLGQNLENIILKESIKNGIESTVVHSLMINESNYDYDAISKTGAVGLGQLSLETARLYHPTGVFFLETEYMKQVEKLKKGKLSKKQFRTYQRDYSNRLKLHISGKSENEKTNIDVRFNKTKNIEIMIAHINWLNNKFNGNLELIAAAYNAGSLAVQKYDGIPPYKETERFVGRVINSYNNSHTPSGFVSTVYEKPSWVTRIIKKPKRQIKTVEDLYPGY